MFKKRLLCLLLACLLLLPLLAACGDKEPKPIEHEILLDGSGYSIIYPGERTDEASAERDAATALYATIYKDTGIKISMRADTVKDGEDPNANTREILVGTTNRTASQNAVGALRAKDYLVTYREGRILILGGSAAATGQAVEYFLKNHYDATKKSITIYENRDDLVKYDYLVGNLSVNGTPLRDYTIVYPNNADTKDPITYYTAINLADYLLKNAGIKLNVVSDSAREVENEILIGATTRSASKTVDTSALSKNEYYLHTAGKKIVMQGKSYLVAGAAGELINNHFKSQGTNVDIDATAIPTAPQKKAFTFQAATSAILLIGDGMGNNHINYTLEKGILDHFLAHDLPYESTCITKSQSVINGDVKYTDSAAAATALATGYKTLNRYLGLDASKVQRQNVRELAHEKGAKTAVITTDALTGATPSGFLCHHNDREDSKTLQRQIDQLVDNGKVDYVYGKNTELITPTREGLNLISEGENSFFVMIEEAHIDKKAHYANSQGVWDSVTRYNEVICYVVAFVMMHPDTALIITADHETGGLTKNEDGSYSFENFAYTEKDGDDYYQHTSTETPIFALGDGVDTLFAGGSIDNTDVAKFIASIYGDSNFGQ